ncbi:MAG TPA: hypothetical protein VMB05_00515 [Solirubrobacteraceae bacterium]|nr:hypothetical protein [Solirubrobacteraceae bacterium]
MRVRLLSSSARARLDWFVRALEYGDEAMAEEILRVSSSRRLFAPLAFLVGAFVMLLQGLRRLLANWRLIPLEVIPAVWLWLAMYDLRLHLLRGRSFHSAHEAPLIPIAALIVCVTIVGLFLNVAFAFAVAQEGTPAIRPAFFAAWLRRSQIALAGLVVGSLLALAVTVGVSWSHPWFALSLGGAVGLMMIVYLSLPARLLRFKPTTPRRDRLAASALGALLAAAVTAPPYVLSRVGVLMLGSTVLAIPGYGLLTLGVILQVGSTGAVRALRMSGALAAVREGAKDTSESA